MFDFHLHTKLSFDSETEPRDMILAAEKAGLCEICLTDHFDHNSDINLSHNLFTPEAYKAIIAPTSSEKIKVRHGVEFGLTTWNKGHLEELSRALDLDFVIGSVHYLNGTDPYFPDYWVGKSVKQCFSEYLEAVYSRVTVHDGYDVLGHINYVCKSPSSPTSEPLFYRDYADIIDEIFKVVISRGKGIEVNTSGFDKVGEYLPSKDFLIRYKELGGEIVTIGSDAHTPERVGQYSFDVADMLKDIFGYACTFEKRKPIFHKL